jgi:prevent-host-death family protein
MEEVGVRELKAKLSEYLGRAAAGEMVVVTDRGKPVARLVGFDDGPALERGIAEGWVEPARRRSLGPAQRHRATESISATLDQDRGS